MGKRPSNPAYPEELNTVGDHLRKVRLDRRLSQANVARILNTSETRVTAWELNRNRPTAKFAKAILEFLGYIPFSLDGCALGKQLFYARLIDGKTQKQVAKIINCDASNLRRIEMELRNPRVELRKKIQEYFQLNLSSFDLC